MTVKGLAAFLMNDSPTCFNCQTDTALSQQQFADTLQSQIQRLQASQDLLTNKHAEMQQRLESCHRRSLELKKNLLYIINLVEGVRCFNMPLQEDEVLASQKLQDLKHLIAEMEQKLSQLPQPVRRVNVVPAQIPQEHQEKLMKVLQEARRDLTTLTETHAKDLRTLKLIKDRVVKS